MATDSAEMYQSDYSMILETYFNNKFDAVTAAETYGRYMLGISIDHLQELSYYDKKRIFNLGYYTWVEQQGVSLIDFEKRKDQQFWLDHYNHMISLDDKIEKFNAI